MTFFYIDCGQSHFCWALYFLSLVIRTLVSLPSDIAPLEHCRSETSRLPVPFGPGHIHDGRQQPQRRQTRQQLGRQGQHTVVGGIKPFLTISLVPGPDVPVRDVLLLCRHARPRPQVKQNKRARPSRPMIESITR